MAVMSVSHVSSGSVFGRWAGFGGGVCGDRRHHTAKDSNEFRTAAAVMWPRLVHGARWRIQAGKHGRPCRRAATEVAGVHLPPVSLNDKWLELGPTDFRIHNPEKQFRGLES